MARVARALFACALLWAAVAATPVHGGPPRLKAGLFLYAAPGLSDPNFARTVIVLLQHGPQGSLGLVVNRPMNRTLREVFDEKLGERGDEVPLFWGGPVQPEAVIALVRAPRPGPRARTVLPEVQLTRDLDEVKASLVERDALLRVRVFSGYAGWGPDQLATEVRRGTWVLEPADAASVFSPEPSRLWDRVHEILGRVLAESRPGPPIAPGSGGTAEGLAVRAAGCSSRVADDRDPQSACRARAYRASASAYCSGVSTSSTTPWSSVWTSTTRAPHALTTARAPWSTGACRNASNTARSKTTGWPWRSPNRGRTTGARVARHRSSNVATVSAPTNG